MAKYYPQRNLPSTAISDGQAHQDRAWKPFPCPLSPFPFPFTLAPFPLCPVPVPICRAAGGLQRLRAPSYPCRGRGPAAETRDGVGLAGNSPRDQQMSGTAMTRGTGGSRSTLAGCKRFPKLMPDEITPRPRAASSSSPVDHLAEPLSRGTGCPCLPQALAVHQFAES